MNDSVSTLTMSQVLESPLPYYFPDFARDSADLFPMPDCNGVSLEETTIDEIQSAMAKGQLTSVNIVTCYLERVYQTNKYIKYAKRFQPTVNPQ